MPRYASVSPLDWAVLAAKPAGAGFEVPADAGVWVPRGGLLLARSAPFAIEAGCLEVIEATLSIAPANAHLRLELAPADNPRRSLVAREFDGGESLASALVHVPRASERAVLQLRLMGQTGEVANRGLVPAGFSFTLPDVRRAIFSALPPLEAPSTELAHWNALERGIHRLCKRSRFFNGLVAALEVRIAREEVLSLPQYLALCPTGQCNATCAFCSVSINRTGIVKRQLSLDAIRRFTAPASRTARMYGIEGNGEPTLYRDFTGLAQHVLSDGSLAYLITNASQVTPETLPLLLGFDSINISMNAATADTHRRVMGLKGFDEICANIRELTRRRGRRGMQPHVSVSFVVTRDNAHEAVAFLELAEDLGVDRALLRPLSELGNDLGTVEDIRDLVPYDSDIADLIEAVGEHLEATKARRRLDVFFVPETFKAVRPDPPLAAVLPVDRPDKVPLPRRRYWKETAAGVDVTWTGPGRFTVRGGAASDTPLSLQSDLVPVPPGASLGVEMTVTGTERAGLEVRVRDHQGRLLGTARPVANAPDSVETLRVGWEDMPVIGIQIEIVRPGAGPLDVEVDLGRVRKPAPLIDPHPAVPPPVRWEHTSPAAEITWAGNVQRIRWAGAPGPYLAKSYSRQCLPGIKMTYPVAIEVRSGRLGIGILSEDAQSFARTFEFGAGRHITDIAFDTGANRRLQLVAYSVDTAPLDVEIDWSKAMAQRTLADSDLPRLTELAERAVMATSAAAKSADVVPLREQRREAQRQARVEIAARVEEPSPAAAPKPVDVQLSRSRGGSFKRLFRDDRTIHCHKPWTDLANFSVDGRVDVCCIATGASQKRFELGNLNTQNFQDVWNGERAREFRRTVNDPQAALPPCQRCPMSKAYQGAFLDPGYSCFQVWRRTKPHLFTRRRFGRQIHRAVFIAIYGPIHLWLFRGYKRAERFPLSELDRWYDG